MKRFIFYQGIDSWLWHLPFIDYQTIYRLPRDWLQGMASTVYRLSNDVSFIKVFSVGDGNDHLRNGKLHRRLTLCGKNYRNRQLKPTKFSNNFQIWKKFFTCGHYVQKRLYVLSKITSNIIYNTIYIIYNAHSEELGVLESIFMFLCGWTFFENEENCVCFTF